jgi:ssDNA-binding Zn-finger/Zn-ribbon topoisomerase 1
MLAKTVKALGWIAHECLLYRMGRNAGDSRGGKDFPSIGDLPKCHFSAGAKKGKRACSSIHHDTAPGGL